MPDLVPGVRVRFTRDIERLQQQGTVLSRTDSSMLVRNERDGWLTRAVLDSLTDLAVAVRRTSGTGARRGAWVGLRLGAVLTLVASSAVWLSHADEQCDDCFISSTAATLALGVVGTGALTIGGALIGAGAPGEDWHTLVPARTQRGGFQAALRLGIRIRAP